MPKSELRGLGSLNDLLSKGRLEVTGPFRHDMKPLGHFSVAVNDLGNEYSHLTVFSASHASGLVSYLFNEFLMLSKKRGLGIDRRMAWNEPLDSLHVNDRVNAPDGRHYVERRMALDPESLRYWSHVGFFEGGTEALIYINETFLGNEFRKSPAETRPRVIAPMKRWVGLS